MLQSHPNACRVLICCLLIQTFGFALGSPQLHRLLVVTECDGHSWELCGGDCEYPHFTKYSLSGLESEISSHLPHDEKSCFLCIFNTLLHQAVILYVTYFQVLQSIVSSYLGNSCCRCDGTVAGFRIRGPPAFCNSSVLFYSSTISLWRRVQT